MTILGRLRFPPAPRVGWIVLPALLGLASALACAQETGTGSIVYVPREPAGSIGGLLGEGHDFGAPDMTASGGVRHHEDLGAPETALGAVRHRYDFGQLDRFRAAPRLAPEATEADRTRATPTLPDLMVLAPPMLAHTLSPQPTLYWYVSGPSNAPVRLTLFDLEAASREALLDLALGTAPKAGVYATPLAKHGVHLERGHRYAWSVALKVNPEVYPEEPAATTILATAKDDPTLLDRLAVAPPLARIEALAAAGYWYDALDLLARQIAANDRTEPWRELCARLLEQEEVGLQAVAAFTRGERGPGPRRNQPAAE